MKNHTFNKVIIPFAVAAMIGAIPIAAHARQHRSNVQPQTSHTTAAPEPIHVEYDDIRSTDMQKVNNIITDTVELLYKDGYSVTNVEVEPIKWRNGHYKVEVEAYKPNTDDPNHYDIKLVYDGRNLRITKIEVDND